MKFPQKLIHGKLIQRYKRFLADVELSNGEVVTSHCTNSGSMKTCIEEGAPVYLSLATNPKRKTRFTWEMIYINYGWVGINTNNANEIAYESIRNGEISKLNGYNIVKREVKFHDSRFDIYTENHSDKCFIEVKNVSMKNGRYARFPDSVTIRGKKHLETLIKAKQEGYRAVMLYIIQRMDIDFFGPAWNIDPEYAETLVKANEKGVEIIPVIVEVSPNSIEIFKEISYNLARN